MILRYVLSCGLIAGGLASSCQAATCVNHTFTDEQGKDVQIALIASDDGAEDLVGAGFAKAAAPCDLSAKRLQEYRNNICNLAAFGNDAVQNRFTQVLGKAPSKLCDSAKNMVAKGG